MDKNTMMHKVPFDEVQKYHKVISWEKALEIVNDGKEKDIFISWYTYWQKPTEWIVSDIFADIRPIGAYKNLEIKYGCALNDVYPDILVKEPGFFKSSFIDRKSLVSRNTLIELVDFLLRIRI